MCPFGCLTAITASPSSIKYSFCSSSTLCRTSSAFSSEGNAITTRSAIARTPTKLPVNGRPDTAAQAGGALPDDDGNTSVGHPARGAKRHASGGQERRGDGRRRRVRRGHREGFRRGGREGRRGRHQWRGCRAGGGRDRRHSGGRRRDQAGRRASHGGRL